MPKKKTTKSKASLAVKKKPTNNYQQALLDIKQLVQQARYASARSVNAIMTVTYWEIGRRIVRVEQKDQKRANYGEKLIKKMSKDLTKSCGKGFGERSLERCRQFYLTYARSKKSSTVLTESLRSLKSGKPSEIHSKLPDIFPLPWTAYVRLLSVEDKDARKFYEEEALRGGWSVRQLDRQIRSQFYTRTLLSKNKMAMLTKGAKAKTEDKVTPEEAVKDPYILEFLNLKDEYSESELEEALIHHLESFLIELGGDFAFIGRQKRLRIGDEWFRVDLVFFHRGLNCLVIIELKVNDFSYADAAQMNMYLNYAGEHWTKKNENPPVGLILCTGKEKTLVKYTLKGMSNKILTADYTTKLPSTKLLTKEIEKTKKMLELRKTQSSLSKSEKSTNSTSTKKGGK